MDSRLRGNDMLCFWNGVTDVNGVWRIEILRCAQNDRVMTGLVMGKDRKKRADEAGGVTLLELLRRGGGSWQGSDELRKKLWVSSEQLRNQIERIEQMGYKVDADAVHGFRLAGAAGKFCAEAIKFGLATKRIGKKVLVYESTDSTNDVAWQYAKEEGYDGLAVFAEEQGCGRGRMGNCWQAKRSSSVLGSVLLEELSAAEGPTLTLLAGLVTAAAIENICSIEARIKWPNDVMVAGRKVAGVMVESRQINGKFCYVVGVGINCRQKLEDFEAELRDTAVSLGQISRAEVDRVQLAQELLRQLDEWIPSVQGRQTERLHDEWLRRCDDIGRRITVVCDGKQFSGRVIDVSCAKGLLLGLDGGAVQVFDGATTSVVRD